MYQVLCTTQKIPRGRVATYSAIARALGRRHAARAVGNALNKNRSKDVPCHRVICADGSIGGFAHGTREKANHLSTEGIKIKNGKVEERYILHRLS